jgi:methionine-rich copper-binding protein CopC
MTPPLPTHRPHSASDPKEVRSMRTRTLLTAAFAAGLLALPAAAPAYAAADRPQAEAAHTGVVSRTPAAGRTASNVKRVAVTFSQRLTTGKIDVYRGSTRVKPASSGPRGATVAASFSRKLAAGSYTARWRAVSSDGHVQTGSWSFKVR